MISPGYNMPESTGLAEKAADVFNPLVKMLAAEQQLVRFYLQ